ncbi:unnamed protein product [Ranitomeya imitator]|uniref:Reverse transcriptase domain-containing protein n=1 Tax=Ranitomeya imitator TaxID=111125 RepID=A0ABN9L198_9NEOB|nr:unnamed protein product [Ranitomeya imitator]
MLGSLTNISGTEYHKVQRIPRGLRVSLRPTLFSEKADFCEKFEAILNKCSMDLILLTVDYLHKEIPIIENEIASIESQLRNTMSQEEFNKIKTHIDKTMIEFQTQLQERKRLKFIRDSDDYQRGELYRCTNKNPETTERRPYRRWNSSYSSGSESDGYRSSFRSYQGRGRNPRNRSNRQNSSAAEPPSTRMQTRSQVSTDLLVYNISSQVLSSMELQVYHPVETYISLVKNEVRQKLMDIQQVHHRIRNNMSRAEREAIDSLRSNKKLVIKPADKGGRPIVASTGSLLSPLAMVLEKISPFLCHIPSFLRDTSHFLSAIRGVGIVPTECYLVTLDVNSLYTNINNTDGIKAVKSFLDDTTEFSPDLKEICITLLTVILTKNFFLFEDDFFIQLNGTAMGSNVAPPYANIFMADFECKFVYTHVLFQQFCPLWKRYIDDVFLIWNGDLDSLLSFYQSINSARALTFISWHLRIRLRSALCHTSGGPLPHFRPVFHVRMRIAALIRRVLFRFED